MGSNLYLSIDVHRPDWQNDPCEYIPLLFRGPSCALDRGIVVDAFGGSIYGADFSGYLTPDEIDKAAERPGCPWREDEPYWVRKVDGAEFVAIVREKRWQRLQKRPSEEQYDFHDQECSPELRAFAALVESLLADGCGVRVWLWHSQ